MTRARVYGEDSPFGDWLRNNRRIDSVKDATFATDVDFVLHKYLTHIDGKGRRDVQLMMHVEVKTHGVMPTDVQRQTLFFSHQANLKVRGHLWDSIAQRKVHCRLFGWFVLCLSYNRPDNGEIRWCVFDERGQLRPHVLTLRELEDVLRFDLDPREPSRALDLRRHHKDTRQPVLFSDVPVVVKRS